jgi:hypothetical protein
MFEERPPKGALRLEARRKRLEVRGGRFEAESFCLQPQAKRSSNLKRSGQE